MLNQDHTRPNTTESSHYRLHPVKMQETDRTAYLMVKALLVMNSEQNYKRYQPESPDEETMDIKALAERFEKDDLLLVIPAHHRMFRLLPTELSHHRMLILVYRAQGEDLSKKAFVGFISEDLSFHQWRMNLGRPCFYDETDQLQEALWRVLTCVDQDTMQRIGWYDRLADSLDMLAKRADGLHILHNAGFFDADSLWPQLLAVGVAEREVAGLKAALTHSLASFAMLVVNGLWVIKK
ncbi:MAG: hypothetical protein IJ527_09220 [Prevotella sp.]|nr:hypothetical protein [Prevotella sp.]